MYQSIIAYFESIDPILAAFYATMFTWFLTALGASFVFFFKNMNRVVLDGMLGFTGGVMVAASFWSLLAPAIEMSPGEGFTKVIPAAREVLSNMDLPIGVSDLVMTFTQLSFGVQRVCRDRSFPLAGSISINGS